MAGAPPRLQVLERLRQHPVADARRQPGVLDQRQELHRRDQAALRMVPAHQRFQAEHHAAAHVHLGLVVQRELRLVQRLVHAADRHHAFFVAPAVFRVEELTAVAAGLLGAVHRVVGMAQQRVGVAAVDRVDGRTHAGGDMHRLDVRVDRVGLGHHAQHALDRQARLLHRRRAQQQHELVAAQPPGRVGPQVVAAQRAAQPAGQLDQQPVAGRMSELIVHRLEAVQIQVTHRQQVTAAVGRGDGLGQHLHQPRAVGQPRQLVEMRLALEAIALLPLFGDVGDHQHVVLQLAAGVVDGRDRRLQGAQLAVAAPLDHFAAPVAGIAQAGPHQQTLLAHQRVGRRGAQQRRHAAQQFLARHAEDLAVRRVDVEHVQLRIGDQQPLVQVLEQAGRQALALARVVALAAVGQRGDHARGLIERAALGHHQLQFQPAPAVAAMRPQFAACLRQRARAQLLEQRLQRGAVDLVDAIHPGRPRRRIGAAQAAPLRRRAAVVAPDDPLARTQAGAIQREQPALLDAQVVARQRVQQQHVARQQRCVDPRRRLRRQRRQQRERARAQMRRPDHGHGQQRGHGRTQTQPAVHQHRRRQHRRQQQQQPGQGGRSGRHPQHAQRAAQQAAQQHDGPGAACRCEGALHRVAPQAQQWQRGQQQPDPAPQCAQQQPPGERVERPPPQARRCQFADRRGQGRSTQRQAQQQADVAAALEQRIHAGAAQAPGRRCTAAQVGGDQHRQRVPVQRRIGQQRGGAQQQPRHAGAGPAQPQCGEHAQRQPQDQAARGGRRQPKAQFRGGSVGQRDDQYPLHAPRRRLGLGRGAVVWSGGRRQHSLESGAQCRDRNGAIRC